MTQAFDDTLIGEDVHGGFKITKRLGEGGMGAVYLAESVMLGKKVAIKILLPEYAENPAILNRFIQEARAATAVRNTSKCRHIIDILGFDQFPDGRHYFKMEFIEGRDLRGYTAYCVEQYGEVPIDRALEILCQVAAALEAVHRAQIVHRDLKPENIMVAPTDDHLVHVTVLDFGIAKLSAADIPNAVKTGAPVRMGTPGYWSPEQARGDHVDTRSDVFAVGVIAFEMMTGRLPNGSQADPGQHKPAAPLPEGWIETIRRALAFDPQHRPQTIRAFISPLIDAVENGQELAARAAPSLFRAATANDLTMKHHGHAPMAGAARTPPIPTTLRGAAGEAHTAKTERGGPKVGTMVLGGALLVALGVAGMVLALRSGESGQQPSSARPATEAGLPAADAAVAPSDARQDKPTQVKLTVTSQPPGARVFVGDEKQARGPAPVVVVVERGTMVSLRGTLKRHDDAIMKLTAPDTDQLVSLVFTSRPRRPSSRTPHRRKARRQTKDTKPADTSLFPTGGVGGN